MSSKYDDIIHLPHHVSSSRPQMSREDRAAQFSPFAALTGYQEAIKETGRLTDRRIELDEYEKAVLDEQLHRIAQLPLGEAEVTIRCFRPDEKKSGGQYVEVTGFLRKIDSYRRTVLFQDGTEIPIEDILQIEENHR